MKALVKAVLRKNPLPVSLQEKLMFFGKCGYWPDFDNPRSFNEKVNWRKLHSADTRFATLCDKLAARDHVREKIGAAHLVPLLYAGESIDPEQLLALGDDIVVKANHDAGSVVIIRRNSPEVAARACEKIQRCLRRNYGAETREWWYARVKPRVLVERFLCDTGGSKPFDVKFFVFRGRDGGPPRAIIEVDHERGTPDHHRTFYDQDGNILKINGEGVSIDSQPNRCVPFPRPEHLKEMRRLAFKLGEDFDHVRVDLYIINGHTYFGELTFSDGGGRSCWNPRSFDFQLGDLWDLDRGPGCVETDTGLVEQVPAGHDPGRSLGRRAFRALSRLGNGAAALLGRASAFLALPARLVQGVDWTECPRHPLLVWLDHCYLQLLGQDPGHYAACRLHEKPRREWKLYYGQGRAAVARRAGHAESAALFEDKEACHALCQSFLLPQPRLYGAIEPGEDFAAVVEDLFLTQGARRIFIKPVNGEAGLGACVAQRESGRIVVRRAADPGRSVPLERFVLSLRSLLEEGVEQHPDLAAVFRNSLNTLRFAALFTPEKEVLIAGAILRMGRGMSFVDSCVRGGIAAPVDLGAGRLSAPAVDGAGRRYPRHPDTGAALEELALPHWSDALELVRETQRHCAPFNRFIGVDIGLAAGGPVLVEVSGAFNSCLFEAANGPLLAVEEVRRCFLRYGLVSRRQLA